MTKGPGRRGPRGSVGVHMRGPVGVDAHHAGVARETSLRTCVSLKVAPQELYMTDSEPHNRSSLGPTALNPQPGKAAQPEMKNCPQHPSTEQTPGSEAFRVGSLGTQLFGRFGFHTSSSGPGGTFISRPSAQKWAGRLRVGHSHMLPAAAGTPRCPTPEAPGTPRDWSRKPRPGGLTLGVQTGNKTHVFKH